MRIKTSIRFGFVHLTLLIACLLISYSLSMGRFDTGDMSESTTELITGVLTNILMSPGKYIWTPWASKNLHNIFEWLLLICNSGLWGATLAYLYEKIKKNT